MALGDTPYDGLLLTAWDAFCGRLREAGDLTFRESTPATDLDRTATLRYLAQNLGNAWEMAFENRNTRYPYVLPFVSPSRKLSGDNADQYYLQSWIDGHHTYRIFGNRGTVRFMNITIQGPWQGPLHDPFGDLPEANIHCHDLKTDKDGNFEVWISPEFHEGNWLQSNVWTRKIFFRQAFDSWDEKPALYWIERVGMSSPPRPPSHQDIIASLQWMGGFVTNTVLDWPDTLRAKTRVGENEVNSFVGERARRPEFEAAQDHLKGRDISTCHWRLGEGEALVFDFVPPPDVFWMVTNEHVNNDSQDFRYRPVSYTPSRTFVNSDGKIRFIVSHTDPGYANWVDTSRFAEGSVLVRFMLAYAMPEITSQLVPSDRIGEVLPPDMARVTPAERHAQMVERMRAIRRRYQPWTFGI